MMQITGDFFELHEGDNQLTVTAFEEITIEVRCTPNYLYNVYPEEMGFD